jgi:hypothetical protein
MLPSNVAALSPGKDYQEKLRKAPNRMKIEPKKNKTKKNQNKTKHTQKNKNKKKTTPF